MSVKVGNVEFHAGPKAIGAPDDLEKVIVKFIDGATKRLEVAVQELDNETIVKALIRARERKVLVKIVLEQDYLKVGTARKKPFEAGGKNESNRRLMTALFRAKIDLKLDFNTSIFHQKFIIRDRSALLTGSTNFTPTGTGKNLNHLIIIDDETVAKIYAREFREIQQGHFGKLNEGHDAKPTDTVVSNVPMRIAFSPDHNPEMEIMKQIMKARNRIDFAIFTFSKSSGIDDAMLTMLELGLPIRGAFHGMAGAQWVPSKTLKAKGANLFGVPGGNGLGKLHHKLMVLDDQVVIGGSFNYTGPANNLNDENIVILGDLEATGAQKTAQKKIATFARKEIDRIIATHGVPL